MHQKQSKDNHEGKESFKKVKKNMLYCYQCDFVCTTKKHATQVHEDHSSIGQKKCSLCDFKCISEDVLKNHMNMNHTIDWNKSTSDCEEAPGVSKAELDDWIAKESEK